MSDNPYQSPLSSAEPLQAVGVLSGRREDVRAVAVYQKGILVCILLYLLVVVGAFVGPVRLRLLIAIAVIVIELVGLVFVFLLSTKVYGTVAGVLLGILTLVPCLGLLALLRVNAKATTVLRQNGHKVGLLGASISKL